MSAHVLAFAESRGGELRRAALEAVTAARRIADTRGGQVHAILFGAAGIGAHASALGAHGADRVLVVEHAGFALNNPEAVAAVTISAEDRPGKAILLITKDGIDSCPRPSAVCDL